ncbi:hypothetical protein [Kitasatospora aureofaciens]|uniref:hypothetical protein n=1 Tax=Kitasatospora aureofaciens TaxID=1894 RepID=UPI001C46ECC6|nr:hypothetical protein [Kitasatospora aureofaciens]MBV6699173.1 hypothetical protein [Kitasatospora aureofaciens]
MPLDPALAARMADADFWPRYLLEDDDTYDEGDGEGGEDEFQARFALDDGHALLLDISLPYTTYDLQLTAPGLPEPVQLGWDDQAHFHPHVLRWAELDRLARAFALTDPQLPHPGPVLALLARFTVLDEHDDPDTITPLLDAAFHHVRPGAGGGPRPETRDWWELRNLAATGLTWVTREDGHPACDQPDDLRTDLPLYSLRTVDGEDFPFAAFAALTARADRILADAAAHPALTDPAVRAALGRCTAPDGHTHLPALGTALDAAGHTHPVLRRALRSPHSRAEACWAVETLAALTPGELVRRWFGPSPLNGARHWDLTLELPTLARPFRYARHLADDLTGRLKAAARGHADLNGGTTSYGPDGARVAETSRVQIRIRDDLAAGLAVIAATLTAHTADPAAVLKHAKYPYEVVELP